MKGIEELRTLVEVDERVGEIGRYIPDLEERAKSRTWTVAERAADPKLDAMCQALGRRAELEIEIQTGFRSADGCLDVRV